ncbi:MAG: sulfatase [Verrucomicrobiales bacterium]
MKNQTHLSSSGGGAGFARTLGGAIAAMVGGVVLAGSTALEVRAEDEDPNLLWIVADDFGPELGCYGYENVATPNIDRLASEGVRFTRAFASSPVCSSSRSAFITGMYQTSIGAHHHRAIDAFPDLPEEVTPLPRILREAGYYTTNQPDALGTRRRAKVDYNFNHDLDQLFSGDDFRDAPEGRPFFAQVQIFPPHRAFPTDPVSDERLAAIDLPPYYPDHPLVRRDWAAYLLAVEELDRLVGATLDQLEESGLADNTIVVFFGDHGRPHVRGKQWLYEPGLHVPLIVRWPGRIEPGIERDELVSLIDLAPTSLEWLGENVPDWMEGRSFADPDTGGRDYVFAARDRAGDAEDRIRSVRGERFKYIRNFRPELPYLQTSIYKEMAYPTTHVLRHLHARGELSEEAALLMAETRPPEEFYDLENDPHELNNLAEDPAHREELEAMRRRLDDWISETGDRGAEIEDAEMVQSYRDERYALWRRWLKARGLPEDPEPADLVEWWMGHYE